ncbi:hypothetical protein CspeluHIS016_0111970 [Cutaneotrichosporon spelunceum]|uniref:Uncharacterized protein n=1 Tax=Cutaneotrichosporon spelunceum TaxID=1672016 RepID=A0AAD3TPF2_9TREE|nr:hypothetical protein CspeluHIS016_0111970 [Cutaneotrichosporon spelunceum]
MEAASLWVGIGIRPAVTGPIYTTLPKMLRKNLSAMGPDVAKSTATAVYGNLLKFIAQYKHGTLEPYPVDEDSKEPKAACEVAHEAAPRVQAGPQPTVKA